jgi:hypothetical protein
MLSHLVGRAFCSSTAVAIGFEMPLIWLITVLISAMAVTAAVQNESLALN